MPGVLLDSPLEEAGRKDPEGHSLVGLQLGKPVSGVKVPLAYLGSLDKLETGAPSSRQRPQSISLTSIQNLPAPYPLAGHKLLMLQDSLV